MVWCQGARAATALAAAGFTAIAVTEDSAPKGETVRWAHDRVKGREWVMWPPKTERGFKALYGVFDSIPPGVACTWADVSRLAPGENADALDAVGVLECIRERGAPAHTPEPDTTAPRRVSDAAPQSPHGLPLDVWATDDKGAVSRDSPHNIRSLLHREGVALRWNSLLHRAIGCRDGAEWTFGDNEMDDLFLRAYEIYGFRPSPKQNFIAFLGAIARQDSFDAVVQYLERCPEPKSGDPAKGMRWLVGAVGLDPENSLDYRAVSITMLGIIARQYFPGCPWKYMWILAGDQDCGKSAAVAALCPDKAWLRQGIEKSEFRDKKVLAESTEGIIIVEMAELSAMNSKEDAAFKSRLSETKDGP